MLLALLLIPIMKSSPTNPSPPIITVLTGWSVYPSHLTMKPPKSTAVAPIADAAYLKFMSANKEGNGQQLQYGRSKLLCMYFMRELAARVPASKVILNTQDPGTAWTGVTKPNKDELFMKVIMKISVRPVEVCARTLVHAAAVGEETHGKLMLDYDIVRYVL
jgi:NAD(P)-dependent dehydrogenase (short-subunit alcohol dehydrogenase family)